ncbi:RDD family protein [Ramlibacter sp.]|uniref:RDD family protein n=1 Tax=Ramlibacter sp. TaxID=1917967 RepID=UPI002BD3A9ED|nr:RDD family protein [Ramlibacter sp.]HWI80512.1 RDD family protein [Ramlibacter sp.]
MASQRAAGAASAADPVPADLTAPPLARRMACWCYEGVLLFAVVFIAGWLFSALGQVRDAMDARRPLLQAFLFVVFGIYFTWFWTKGQTLAMKTWKIRIVDTAGRRLGQPRALLRYVCSWLWFLPPLALLAAWHATPAQTGLVLTGWVALWALASRLHPQRQFWHDALAGTRLIRAGT